MYGLKDRMTIKEQLGCCCSLFESASTYPCDAPIELLTKQKNLN